MNAACPGSEDRSVQKSSGGLGSFRGFLSLFPSFAVRSPSLALGRSYSRCEARFEWWWCRKNDMQVEEHQMLITLGAI